MSYECFSILCDAFLLKRVISSHNSCVIVWDRTDVSGDKSKSSVIICSYYMHTLLSVFKCLRNTYFSIVSN